MADEETPKKPKGKKPAAPKPPKTAAELIVIALKTAATKPKANWSGASGSVLFSTKEENHLQAIEQATTGVRPLLKHVEKGGVLTPHGFAQVASELSDDETAAAYERLSSAVPEEQAGALAKVAAGRLPLARRIEFVQDVIRRNSLAAAELLPVLEAATAAEKVEQEARIEAAQKRREAEEANETALRRMLEVFAERRHARLDALRREYEIEGGKASELPEATQAAPPERKPISQPTPEPKTHDELDYRRNVADRLTAAWRDEMAAGHAEGCNALETAIWNIRGMKMIGEVGQQLPFDGRLHESATSVAPKATVRIARPGWLLKVDDEDYVALPAAVEPV